MQINLQTKLKFKMYGLYYVQLEKEEKMIGKLIALIIVLVGVKYIFDARILTKKWFGFGDQNEATSGIKILGFIISIIGAIIIYVM